MAIFGFTLLVGYTSNSYGQATRTWTSNGTTSVPWLTAGNWSGSVFAGGAPLANPTGEGATTDIMAFAAANTGTTAGINMNTLAAAGGVGLSLGGINLDRTATSAFQIGNSSSTVSGIMQLNGATINSVANTLIRVHSGNMTITNVATGATDGGQTLGLRLGLANGIFDVSSTRTLTIASNISEVAGNSSGFSKTGAGTLTLSGANTYTGNTTISAGTLSIATTGALPGFSTDGRYSVAGGATLAVRNAVTDGNIASMLGTANFAAGSSLGFDTTTADRAYSVVLANTAQGALGLTKLGANTLTLDQANSYTGATTINGGILNATTFAAGGSNSSIGAGSVAATNLVLNGGTLQYNSAAPATTDRLFSVGTSGGTIDSSNATAGNALSFTGTGDIGLNGQTGTRTLTLTGSNTGDNTIALKIVNDGANATSLAKSGAGTWILTNANTYSGTTTVSGGTLVLTNSMAGGGAISTNTTGAISQNAASVISGNSAVSIGGSGASVLSGNNTYSGLTTVSGSATLTLSGDNSGMGGGVTLSTSGTGSTTPRLNVNNPTALGTGTLTFGGGLASDTVRLDNTSAGSVTVSTNNAMTLNRNFTFIGTEDLNLGAGTTTLGGLSANASRVITVTAKTLTLGGNIGEATSGNGNGITLSGSGTLVLNGASTYTGTTNIGVNAAGSGTQRIRVNSIADLGVASALGAPTTATNGLITIGAGSNAGTLEFSGLSGHQTTNRQVRIGTNNNGSGIAIIQNNDPNYTVTFSNTTFNVIATHAGFNRSLTLGGSNIGDNTIAGAIVPNNSGINNVTSLVKNGAGTWVLGGSNTFTGNTVVDDGILKVSTIGDVGVASNVGAGSSIRLGGTTTSGILQYTGGAATTNRPFFVGTGVAGDTGGGRINNTGSGTLTFNGTNFNTALSGVTAVRSLAFGGNSNIIVSGGIRDNDTATGGIVNVSKFDSGILTLSGASTYTGSTSVNQGTLVISNTTGSATGTGAVAVAAGAKLAGTGTIGGPTTISGTHSPGNSPGIMTHLGDLTYSGTTPAPTVEWELEVNSLATRGTNFDGINVGGNLNFASPTTLALDFNNNPGSGVNWTDSFWNTSRLGASGWLIYSMTGSGSISNFNNLILGGSLDDSDGNPLLAGRGSFSLFNDPTGIYLNFTAVPEPASLGGALVLLGTWSARLRRNRKKITA